MTTKHIMITMDRSSPNTNKFTEWCHINHRISELVDGVVVRSIESIKDYLTPYGYYIMQNQRETSIHFDTLGPIGCFLAHRDAWGRIVTDDSCDHCWVFEEGVSDYYDDIINRVDNAYDHFDFLHGHTVTVVRLWKQKQIRHTTDKFHYNNGIVPIDKIYYGTKCYRISKKFAKLLLDHSTQFDMHVDSYMCIMAIYYSDIILSGHTTENLVQANSSKRINHSLDIQLTLSMLHISIIVISIVIICILLVVRYRCKK